jgi:hypothetical protein
MTNLRQEQQPQALSRRSELDMDDTALSMEYELSWDDKYPVAHNVKHAVQSDAQSKFGNLSRKGLRGLRFTDGELVVREKEIEYRLSSVRNGRLAHYGQREIVNCFAGKRILFYGDSRIRNLFSSFVEALVGEKNFPASFAHHRACPFYNKEGHSDECRQWFTGAEPDSTLEIEHAGVHVIFKKNLYASQYKSLPNGRPDFLLLDNGAWSVFGNIGHGESDEDRIRFIHNISHDLLNSHSRQTEKLFVKYPNCFLNHPEKNEAQATFDQLVPALIRNNWTVYDPSFITDPKVWVGLDYAKAWSPTLLPRGSQPTEAKWDQCQSVHTWDSLTDLEMQVIFNNWCPLRVEPS